MKILVKYICSILALIFALSSCVDKMLYLDADIPDGETEFAATLSFPAFAPALESRGGGAPGNAIKKINTLWLVIYQKSESGDWTLEPGGKIHITPESHDLVTSVADNVRPDGADGAETNTGHASFRLRHKNGQYRIYAVANCDMSTIADADIATPEKLKGLKLTWNNDDVLNNSEMFGCFTNNKSGAVEADETVIISPNRTLHAWIRRAASKLTIAFDTRKLKENIQIYIRSVTVADIPGECYLGESNTPSADRQGISNELVPGDTLYFGSAAAGADDYASWRMLTKETGLWGYRTEKEFGAGPVPDNVATQPFADRRRWEHDEAADTLYFYENMQGSGKNKAQTAAGPGNGFVQGGGIGFPNPDKNQVGSGWKDNKPYGSYVEVDGYYISNVKGNESRGRIKYRFMLGKDTKTDYNAERNYHYKLTLVFNGYANDVDWHIEYKEQVLQVSQPKVFNYRGLVFEPDYTLLNRGHTFLANNSVTVSSYEGDINDPGSFRDFEIKFKEKGKDEGFTDKCDWLKWTIDDRLGSATERVVNFFADTTYVEFDIDASLQAAGEKGSEAAPYNLSDQGGITNSNDVGCTANCYIVSSAGCYMFPLVYGNAFHNGIKNENSYKYTGSKKGDNILVNFRNHLDNVITEPYIKDNADCHPAGAWLVWQDEKDLVKDITYVSTAYGGKGGIRFRTGDLKQGNAVIAVKDDKGRIMWSWHIWVTRFDMPREDKIIKVTGHESFRKFELMPVNLGWCSDHGARIKYYKGRECQVKIISGQLERIITIVQKPHIALPRGNNPYYQWGRKDPFIGTNIDYGNKPRWDGDGKHYEQWSQFNPPRLTDDSKDSLAVDRITTRQALHLLIQKPDVWHNPPRRANPKPGGEPWVSNNETYANLWEGRSSVGDTTITLKTVYDPCPVGYQVCHYNAFSGFTVSGDNISIGADEHWFHVRTQDVADVNPTDGLFEFYTDPTKVQSIIFPETGYRDWDAYAGVYHFGVTGYVWAAGNVKNDDNYSYNFMFSRTFRDDKGNPVGLVMPKNTFFPCDGFPVRPCVYERHGTDF